MKFKDFTTGDMFNTKAARWVKTDSLHATCVMSSIIPIGEIRGHWQFKVDDDLIPLYQAKCVWTDIDSYEPPTANLVTASEYKQIQTKIVWQHPNGTYHIHSGVGLGELSRNDTVSPIDAEDYGMHRCAGEPDLQKAMRRNKPTTNGKWVEIQITTTALDNPSDTDNMISIERDELLTSINTWLDQKRESTGGWAEITDEDIEGLHWILHDLIHLKCGTDPDGDVPIEYKIINRRTHERLNFQPVPYDLDLVHGQRRPIEGQLSILMQHWANLQTATSKFDTAMRCYEAEQRRKT